MTRTFLMAASMAMVALSAQPFAGQDKGVFMSSADIVFDEIIPGTVAFATVQGNREKGPHGTFVRVPAGQATPMHTHGAAYHAVVIDGHFENPIEGDDASDVTLTKGSYYYVPAGAAHITRCADDSPVDCLTFFYQEVPFDFAVAE